MLSFIKKHIHPITGLLFFVGLGLIGYYTIIDTQEFDDEGTVRIPVRLLTAEGMRPGTKIFVQGVQMGAVGALYYMTLDERGWPRSWSEENTRSHGQTVIAILYLKRGFQFYPNYRIITRYQTVLSAKVIEIEPGNAVPTFMRRHDKLEAKRARGITPTQLNLIPGVSGRIRYSAEERFVAGPGARRAVSPAALESYITQYGRRAAFSSYGRIAAWSRTRVTGGQQF